MLRLSLTALSITLLLCPRLSAQDCLLRLETTGFRDQPQHQRLPPHKVLESIEVLARPNQSFYGTSSVGSANISFSGFLEQLSDGRFRVQIRYRKSTDSGKSIPGPNGTQIPIRNSTNINTTAIIELMKPVELGKNQSVTQAQDGTELRSNTRSLLSLSRFQPGRN